MKVHVIERMTLSKINLLDKVKFEILNEGDTTTVEANNIKLSIFPESLREISRLAKLWNSPQNIKYHRFEFLNKTMKTIHLIPLNSQNREFTNYSTLTIKS